MGSSQSLHHKCTMFFLSKLWLLLLLECMPGGVGCELSRRHDIATKSAHLVKRRHYISSMWICGKPANYKWMSPLHHWVQYLVGSGHISQGVRFILPDDVRPGWNASMALGRTFV